MSQFTPWHYRSLGIATLAFALGAPTVAPAQSPCAGASDAPTQQCKDWLNQQKLNATCMQNPNKPECKDWLAKQQKGKTAAGRTRPVGSGPGDERPGGQDTKGLKRGKGGGTDEKGMIIVNSKSKGGLDLPAVQTPGLIGATGTRVLQNRAR